MSNHNSIYVYLTLKILKDSNKHKNIRKLRITLNEFKKRLSLENKYRSLSTLEKYVLKIIDKDLNLTDIDFSYSLEKGESGKAFKYIILEFDYKPEYIDHKKYKKIIEGKSELISFDLNSIKSPFEQIFKSWGIGKSKIKEIEDQYSLNAISNAIQVTKEAIAQYNIKKSPAAFFLGTLENKQLQEEVDFARAQKDLKKQQKEQERKALASEYDAIQKFVNDNDEELSKYLSAKSLGTEYPLDASLKEEVANLSCVGADKFKNFRPKLAVLEKGYFDSNTSKIVRPNMYNFLIKLAESI